MSRINLSYSNSTHEAIFDKSKGAKGVNGDIKKASFFGQSIKVKGRNTAGDEKVIKLNKGSLIDFLNTQLGKDDQLKKGWFIHASDEKVLAAYEKVFSKASQPSTEDLKQDPISTDDQEIKQDDQPVDQKNDQEIKQDDQQDIQNETLVPDIKTETPCIVREPRITAGKSLSYESVIKRAENHFSRDPKAKELIKTLKGRLKTIKYELCLSKGITPKLGYNYLNATSTTPEGASIKTFLRNLPGVDINSI